MAFSRSLRVSDSDERPHRFAVCRTTLVSQVIVRSVGMASDLAARHLNMLSMIAIAPHRPTCADKEPNPVEQALVPRPMDLLRSRTTSVSERSVRVHFRGPRGHHLQHSFRIVGSIRCLLAAILANAAH